MSPLALLLAAAAPAPAPVTIPAEPELTRQIAAADAALFKLYFEEPCDPARFRNAITDDVEFYHDRGGVLARSAAELAVDYAQTCKGREDSTSWRSRRVLVAGSLHVDPVPGWGAIETGEHLFYERHGSNGTERLAGRARFAQLWVLGSDRSWRLSRIFSYAHEAAK